MARKLLGEGKRDKAMLLLKKRKYQEQLLSKTDAQMMNLEEMVNSIEFAKVEQDVLKGLQSGNDVLKEIQGEMSIEDVERIMDDTREAIEYQNEIEEALAGKLTDEDDADVLQELEDLIEMQKEGEKLDLEQKLPQVPDSAKEQDWEGETSTARKVDEKSTREQVAA